MLQFRVIFWYNPATYLQAYFMQIDGTLNKLTTVGEIQPFLISHLLSLKVLTDC